MCVDVHYVVLPFTETPRRGRVEGFPPVTAVVDGACSRHLSLLDPLHPSGGSKCARASARKGPYFVNAKRYTRVGALRIALSARARDAF
jgi:hypothetical protein